MIYSSSLRCSFHQFCPETGSNIRIDVTDESRNFWQLRTKVASERVQSCGPWGVTYLLSHLHPYVERLHLLCSSCWAVRFSVFQRPPSSRPPSCHAYLLSTLTALHALFTATLKYQPQSEQLKRRHNSWKFFFSPAVQLPKWEGLSCSEEEQAWIRAVGMDTESIQARASAF